MSDYSDTRFTAAIKTAPAAEKIITPSKNRKV
jgi:hypothetical protein